MITPERIRRPECQFCGMSGRACMLRPVEVVSAILSAVPAGSDDVGLPPRQSLTTLLTAESLLFAAFAISATLAMPTENGRALFYARGWFAYLMVLALLAVAIAAMFALYATLQPAPPEGRNAWVRAIGVGVAICMQPIAAYAIAKAARDTTPGYSGD